MVRSFVRVGMLGFGIGMAVLAAPAAAAEEPLSTDWLAAVPLLPGIDDGQSSSCRVQDPAARARSAGTAAKLAHIRALLAADAAGASGGAGEVVVLGNRGYNYGSGGMVDPSLLEFEASGPR